MFACGAGILAAFYIFSRSRALNTKVDTVEEKLIQPNAESHYTVTAADLPLSCPMPGMHLWNSHPRVYLPVEKEGTSKCPYCGAAFTLAD